jgi:hypothetical protein
MMRLVRIIGAVGIVGAAIVVFATQRPADDEALAEADTHAGDVRAALADADANEALADSAPKQQVVNGWVARDLLEIQSQQLDAIAAQLEVLSEPPPRDDRVPLLLLTGVVALGFALVTTRSAGTAIPARSAPGSTPPPPDPQPSSGLVTAGDAHDSEMGSSRDEGG